MKHQTWMDLVNKGISSTTKTINPQEISGFAERILSAKQTFLMGQGRTGLIVQTFGMRLAQLGLPVHIVSQPTTPALTRHDLLILVSGSGETGEILDAARLALKIGADTYAVTQNKKSSLGELIADKLIIPSLVEQSKVLNGTLFEMSLLITLDAVVAELLEISGQSFQDMSERHANIG
jgi:6-phospho-3-hexuloisomerase